MYSTKAVLAARIIQWNSDSPRFAGGLGKINKGFSPTSNQETRLACCGGRPTLRYDGNATFCDTVSAADSYKRGKGMGEKEQEQLTGTVEDIVFRNSDSGFTVLELATEDELVTVVGEVLDLSVGERLTVSGVFGTHPTYGLQFKAELFQRELPSGANAIGKYLASKAIKGIGPVLAQRIVKHFGDDSLEIIERESHRLTEVKGISPKKAAEIAEEYKRIFGVRAVMLFLSAYGVDTGAAIRVWKLWGSLAVQVIRDNPYLLADQVGMPFEQADRIGQELGFALDSPQRVRAGLLHVLRHNMTVGHTCLPYAKLCTITTQYLELDGELIQEMLDKLVADEELACCKREDGTFVGLPEAYTAESYIAGRVHLMLSTQNPDTPNFEKDITALEQELGITFAPLQRKAVAAALHRNLFILTGGPGTGKTTTLNGIIRLLERQGNKVALAAPTGRAAKRMSEVTGMEAKTLHRLLEVDFQSVGGGFKRNERNPLPVDAVIVDEVSMVDVQLFEALLRGIRMTCKVILVGDSDQLPSVGAGNLLGDLISSEVVDTVELTQVFRQAAQSLIVTNAHSIVEGSVPELERKDSDFFFLRRWGESASETTVDLATRRLPTSYGFSPLWDIQVIVPGRKGALGADGLNQSLQQSINPADPLKRELRHAGRVLREGDKVMQIRNNYDILWHMTDGTEGMGIFNGDIGVIDLIDKPSSTILVRFEDRTAAYTFDMADELEHAYAITVHKSQGSEFEAVVMPLVGRHPKLHYRNLLYTGVTRAKKLLVMVGEPATVEAMVANNRRTMRYTNLKHLVTQTKGW